MAENKTDLENISGNRNYDSQLEDIQRHEISGISSSRENRNYFVTNITDGHSIPGRTGKIITGIRGKRIGKSHSTSLDYRQHHSRNVSQGRQSGFDSEMDQENVIEDRRRGVDPTAEQNWRQHHLQNVSQGCQSGFVNEVGQENVSEDRRKSEDHSAERNWRQHHLQNISQGRQSGFDSKMDQQNVSEDRRRGKDHPAEQNRRRHHPQNISQGRQIGFDSKMDQQNVSEDRRRRRIVRRSEDYSAEQNWRQHHLQNVSQGRQSGFDSKMDQQNVCEDRRTGVDHSARKNWRQHHPQNVSQGRQSGFDSNMDQENVSEDRRTGVDHSARKNWRQHHPQNVSQGRQSGFDSKMDHEKVCNNRRKGKGYPEKQNWRQHHPQNVSQGRQSGFDSNMDQENVSEDRRGKDHPADQNRRQHYPHSIYQGRRSGLGSKIDQDNVSEDKSSSKDYPGRNNSVVHSQFICQSRRDRPENGRAQGMKFNKTNNKVNQRSCEIRQIQDPAKRIMISYPKLSQWSQIENYDELAVQLFGAKRSLDNIVNKSDLKDDWIHLLTKVFTGCSKATVNQVKITILAMLQDSTFIKESLPNFMKKISLTGTEEVKKALCEDLLELMRCYLNIFPMNLNVMPIDSLIVFATKIKDRDELQVKIDELDNQRNACLINAKQDRYHKSERKGIIERPPPNDYRDITSHPTLEEIGTMVKPYLRPIKKTGAYDDGAHYLDVQFRLLKEDLLAPIREGIQEVIANLSRRDRKYHLKVFHGVELLNPTVTHNGLAHRIRFDTSNTKNESWEHSKKLIYGSLLCMSSDGFKSMVFATVDNRNAKDLSFGTLDIRFVDGFQAQSSFRRTAAKWQMVESPTYFEAYKHVLDGIKEIDQEHVPMEEYIIHCNSQERVPEYVNGNDATYTFGRILRDQVSGEDDYSDFDDSDDDYNNVNDGDDYSKKIKKSLVVPILIDQRWPKFSETTLNASQYKAFKHALTREFAVIQGPPGTGKTYVGLRIADALLTNKRYWNEEEESPLLLVCYTNHALDQFLEGLINCGHQNIIRVGGRASEMLKRFLLREKTNRVRDEICSIKYDLYNELTFCIEQLERLHDNDQRMGQIFHLDDLRDYISETHLEHFQNYDENCCQVGISTLEVFLGLYKIAPENLEKIYWKEETIDYSSQYTDNSEFDESNEKNDIQNEIKEEDGILERRPVEDEDLYKIEDDSLAEIWVRDKDLHKGSRIDSKRCGSRDIESNQEKTKTRTILVDEEGYQIVQPSKKEKLQFIKSHFQRNTAMNEKEANVVENPWDLSEDDKWRLYKFWLNLFKQNYAEEIERKAEEYEKACETFKELDEYQQEIAMKQADVIAMTTTGAARCRRILHKIKPKIVVIEEAAEVLEAHVITSLTPETKHLILIGDHKQLKPNPSVYELARKYGLEVSLFERMLNNGVECQTLDVQHRMRPEIARLIRHIYPTLKNHSIVENRDDIKGINKNMVFINHNQPETEIEYLKSKVNVHEVMFMARLCKYLLQQGYMPSQITILTGYTGQLMEFKNRMPKDEFKGVKITAIDNYQGEENDIILLSLVRSNTNGKIGFIGKENRVCVALSRAKYGLYVVGNFSLLEEKSILWKKIVSDVKDMDCLQTHLSLHCQNHPSTINFVSNDRDFANVPMGGCTRPCGFRLDCGHSCASACHPVDPKHNDYVCFKVCAKVTCESQHKCRRQCHHRQECGPCAEMIEMTNPKCGHNAMAECSIDPKDLICQLPCTRIREICGHRCQGICGESCNSSYCSILEKKELKCGHNAQVQCSEDVKYVKCEIKCNSIRECDHPCVGTCGECKRGRLHVKCQQECNRVLVCSHICKEKCTNNCPPCKEKCQNGCAHSTCQENCGDPCVPCREKCEWTCKHQTCSNLCSELCDRPPCDEPCTIHLPCGHQCIGLCGEQCPELCRICDKDKVEEIFFGEEDNSDAKFIVLRDCGHILEVMGLDRWMNTTNQLYGDDDNIKLKACPKCNTVVRRSLRYGNFVKLSLNDIEEVKKRVNSTGGDSYVLKLQVVDDLQKLARQRSNEKALEKIIAVKSYIKQRKQRQGFEKLLKSRDFFSEILKKLYYGNNAFEIQHLSNILKTCIYLAKTTGIVMRRRTECLMDDIRDVRKFLANEDITDNQLKSAVLEIKRISIHYSVAEAIHRFEEEYNNEKASLDCQELRIILKEFEEGSFISEEDLDHNKEITKRICQKWSIGEITKEEKEMIITAINLGRGHWYKCQNGHYYVIGECGGAAEEGKCPECKKVIGGMHHRLAHGNAHAPEFDGSRYAAYSEEANNPRNWDPEMLQRLQME